MRLFVGIAIPDPVAQSLALLQAGVPGARWATREQLHLTLRFIGEADGAMARDIDDVLASISVPRFTLSLHGVGTFGGRDPRQLWAGVRDNEVLLRLQKKIEAGLQRIGLPAEERKFTPHVSLAKLKAAPRGRVMDYLSDHALFAAGPFPVENFILYSSITAPAGSIYTAERSYPLA